MLTDVGHNSWHRTCAEYEKNNPKLKKMWLFKHPGGSTQKIIGPPTWLKAPPKKWTQSRPRLVWDILSKRKPQKAEHGKHTIRISDMPKVTTTTCTFLDIFYSVINRIALNVIQSITYTSNILSSITIHQEYNRSTAVYVQNIPWNIHTILLTSYCLITFSVLKDSCETIIHIIQGWFSDIGTILWLIQS